MCVQMWVYICLCVFAPSTLWCRVPGSSFEAPSHVAQVVTDPVEPGLGGRDQLDGLQGCKSGPHVHWGDRGGDLGLSGSGEGSSLLT